MKRKLPRHGLGLRRREGQGSMSTFVGMSPAEMAKRLEDIHIDAVFDDDADTTKLDDAGEQFYLLALAAIETAQRFAALATLHEVKP